MVNKAKRRTIGNRKPKWIFGRSSANALSKEGVKLLLAMRDNFAEFYAEQSGLTLKEACDMVDDSIHHGLMRIVYRESDGAFALHPTEKGIMASNELLRTMPHGYVN